MHSVRKYNRPSTEYGDDFLCSIIQWGAFSNAAAGSRIIIIQQLHLKGGDQSLNAWEDVEMHFRLLNKWLKWTLTEGQNRNRKARDNVIDFNHLSWYHIRDYLAKRRINKEYESVDILSQKLIIITVNFQIYQSQISLTVAVHRLVA